MKNMARFLFGSIALVMIALPLAAQEWRAWDPADGLPVRQGHHIEWFRSTTTDDNGHMALVWSDTRTGDRDLYMQVLDADGNMLWDQSGNRVAGGFGRQEDPHVMPDGLGNWIVTWIDYRYDVDVNDEGDVFIDKIDSDGNSLWTDNPEYDRGIALSIAPGKQLWVQSFTDGNGGAVSIWVSNENQNSDIFGQHTDADGNVQWADVDGMMLAGGQSAQGSITSASYTADTDDAGGIIFGYKDEIDAQNHNVKMNRVDVNGTLMWADSSGLMLCDAPFAQNGLRMCPDGNGGAFWTWKDARLGNDVNIYGQHTDSQGNISWDNNGNIFCDAPFEQKGIRIVNTAPGEAVLVWEDLRVDAATEDLYTQRISSAGGAPVFHWGAGTDGLALCDFQAKQIEPRLYPDGTGGAVYTWVDERFGETPNNDLFGQRIDVDGNAVWGDPDGIAISDAVNSQTGNIVRLVDNDTIGILWFDFRLGSPSLYTQLYDMQGNEMLPDNGDQIIYGMDGDGVQPQIIPADGNNYFIGWLDYRLTDLGTYPFIQKIDGSTGEILFEENGKTILPGFPYLDGDTTVIDPDAVVFSSDMQGGLLACWKDARDELAPRVYAQRLDSNGDPMWGPRGVAVGLDPGVFDMDHPFILADGDGGMYIAYDQQDFTWTPKLAGQHLDANGNRTWGDNGILLTPPDEVHVIQDMKYFDDGSILLVYQRDASDANHKNLYAIRINTDGTMPWGDPVELTDAEDLQKKARVIEVDGAIVVAWEDLRSGGSDYDIYAQMITSGGDLLWQTDGLSLVDQLNQQNEISLASTGYDAASFWMAWKTTQDPDGIEDVRLQEFDLDGNPLINPAGGVLVGVDDLNSLNPAALIDDDGGVFVAWMEGTADAPEDLRYIHYNADGSLVDGYEPEGQFLSQAYHRQEQVALANYGVNSFVATWTDYRATGKDNLKNIYMQRVDDPTDVSEEEAALPQAITLNQAYPNPFNPSTTIEFSIDRNAVVELAVYDVLGRQVKKLVNQKMSAGRHTVQWNGLSAAGQPVASGTYFYRLEVNGKLMTRSMVLLK